MSVFLASTKKSSQPKCTFGTKQESKIKTGSSILFLMSYGENKTNRLVFFNTGVGAGKAMYKQSGRALVLMILTYMLRVFHFNGQC